MKLTQKEVFKVMKEIEPELRKFGIKEIYLFGSVVRGEAKETSDVDFFVVFEDTAKIGLLKFAEIEIFLSEKLQTKVDMGTKRSLHPMLRDQILMEAVRVA